MQIVCLFALLMILYTTPLLKMENIHLYVYKYTYRWRLWRGIKVKLVFQNKVECWALHIFKLYNITSWKAGLRNSYFTDDKPKLWWAIQKTSWLVVELKSSKTQNHPSSCRSTWFFCAMTRNSGRNILLRKNLGEKKPKLFWLQVVEHSCFL